MRWLLSTGGEIEDEFAGVLTTPGHKGVPLGIRQGKPWAADNQAFTKGFDPSVFFPWLDSMLRYRPLCLFVTVPDVVGDSSATIDNFWRWSPHFTGWSLAFAAQDGQENHDFPSSDWGTLFVGGSTEWKEGLGAIECIKRAQALGKHIHIGRVNWWRRYALFRQIKGSEDFTCDGTRQRFEGIDRTKEAWAEYRRRLVLPLW